jgi:hypothetical protein
MEFEVYQKSTSKRCAILLCKTTFHHLSLQNRFFPNSENCIIPRKYKKMVHFSISQSPTIFIVAVEMQILSFKLHFHFIGKLLKFAFAFVQHTLVNYNKNKEPIVMINLKTGYNK